MPILSGIMNALPLEILQRIFLDACTDGGATGRALSLVSKDIRAIARIARFRSVALVARPEKLRLFVALYERERDPARGGGPRIEHLHIAFPHVLGPDGFWVRRNKPTESPEYLAAAQTLFRLIAPHLVTLVVQCEFTSGGHLNLPIIQGPFPRLCEATFVGLFDPRALVAASDARGFGKETAPLFPTLSHLYFVAFRHDDPELCLPFWSTKAPRVTHLGVSGADAHVEVIAEAVGVRLPSPGDSSDYSGPPPSAPTYPSVRRLLVQPAAAAKLVQGRGNPWDYWNLTKKQLSEVVLACAAVGVQAAEIPVAAEDGDWKTEWKEYYARARRGWLERIDDGRDGVGHWGDMGAALGGGVGAVGHAHHAS